MNRILGILLAAAVAVPLSFGGWALAQSSDARLVGTWSGNAGDDKLHVVFNADGTAKMGDQDGSDAATYTADFSKSPGTLIFKAPDGSAEMKSLIEFVDDNHIRISQPSDQLPASMAEGSPVTFERTASTQ